MPAWSITLLAGVIAAISGYLLSEFRRWLEKQDQRRQAAAAFRFELESNLRWLDDIFESRNYLRDEAWVKMKNDGYVSYLQRPIPLKVIAVYDQLHRLNEQIRVLKEPQPGSPPFDQPTAEADRRKLMEGVQKLIELFDAAYPDIGRNFQRG